jgi:hypothetical protein
MPSIALTIIEGGRGLAGVSDDIVPKRIACLSPPFLLFGPGMTTPNSIRTGGEIDAFCGKCELNLAHTIIAMVGPKVVKVKCNTCGSDHQYRGQQPLVKTTSFAAPKKPAGAGSKPRAAAVTVSWDDQFKGKDLTKAKKYSPRETFAVDEVVDHPTFGLGLVRAVRGDKIEVGFKQEDKVLVHGKAPPPAPAAPAAPEGSSDPTP